jgi:hypothetical protein
LAIGDLNCRTEITPAFKAVMIRRANNRSDEGLAPVAAEFAVELMFLYVFEVI